MARGTQGTPGTQRPEPNERTEVAEGQVLDTLPDRRERIATAILSGMMASSRLIWDRNGPTGRDEFGRNYIERAVVLADTLIETLDKPKPDAV